MLLGVNNFIEADDDLGEGIDLRPWAGGRFNPRAVSADAVRLTDVTLAFDQFDDPSRLLLEYADGSAVRLRLEEASRGVFAITETHFPPDFAPGVAFFVGYGLSTSPKALRLSVEDAQAFLSDDELDDILDGFLDPLPSFFTLAGHDEIFGASFDDTLAGAGGDDILRGRGGDDLILGGSGDDTLAGQAGDDTLQGGRGDDAAQGGGGEDRVIGAGGDDVLRGGGGSDTVVGGGGEDTVIGQGGGDILRGGASDDSLVGGGGADRLLGNLDDDILSGGARNDTLIGGSGDDTLTGDGGADRFVFGRNQGSDVILDFEDGLDVIVARGAGDFDALFIFERAGDAVVRYSGTEITLDGIDADQLTEDDFLF